MSNVLLSDLEYIFKNNTANNFFKNKKILITGAAGFLGTYLTNYFLYYIKELEIKKFI